MNSAFSFVEQEIVDFGFIAIETQDANAILSQWELVDATDSDTDSELTEANGAVSDARCVSVVLETADCSDQAGSISLDDADNAVHNANLLEVARIALFENRRIYEHNEREEDEDEDDDGLDDELVPRYLSGKLGRQRMRKLGKRGYAKMNTSKKFPHQYMKPGCVQGKHGLGLNHTVF